MTEAEFWTLEDPIRLFRALDHTNARQLPRDSPLWYFVFSERKMRLFALACAHQINNNQGWDEWAKSTDFPKKEGHYSSKEGALVWCGGKIGQNDPGNIPRVGKLRTCRIMRDIVGNPFQPLGGMKPVENKRICEKCAARYQKQVMWCIKCGSDLLRKWRIRDNWPWLTPTTLSLAEAAHSTNRQGHLDNIRLSILADALEDADCREEQLISHFRQPDRIHYQGCWALDEVLGLE